MTAGQAWRQTVALGAALVAVGGWVVPLRAQAPEASAQHWAFQPVRRPPVPRSEGGNPIDAFVAARLADAGLSLSPEADRTTLIRRLWFVMLGMPPTPDEIDAFVADLAPQAFERLVERALADARYGERWARHWLDVVRFAESHGFETNRERPTAWRFRDYVIAAFRDDKPYDRFVREQLAGDALGADVATGFLVAGPVDIVGSPDPVLTARQRADEVDDMVGTTGTALLGLTIGCARCHAHKFDPISHREYTAMTAIFAGVKHGERALPLAAARAAEVERLDRRIVELEGRLARLQGAPPMAVVGDAGARRVPVDFARNEETFTPVVATRVRFTIFATTGAEPCLDELEVWAGERNVALASVGTVATASSTLPGYAIHQLAHVHDGEVGNDHSWISSEVGGGWVELAFAQPEPISRIVWGRDRQGKVRDRLATRYRIEAALDPGEWRTLASSADRAPLPGVTEALAAPTYRFDAAAADDARQGQVWLAELHAAQAERRAAAPPEMAYAGTFHEPGPTARLHRGDPMQPRETVAPGTPAIFQPMALAADAPEQQRRLALADWIVNPDHPLTARVLVNRVWQHHFGVGIVSTANDFGRNGARPTHPELLDWLASEFVAQGWSIKALQRQILTSATWRQASAPRPAAAKLDADGRLLWRFPPRRLEAEAIRDSILMVSGALDRTAGGPGFHLHDVERENVYHYHPKEDFGPSEARRMVYAFKVRMEQDAIFGAFDCPDGSLVVPRRGASTTPMQALNLFNSRFVWQQAEHFAARLRTEGGDDVHAQVERAWRLGFGRRPARDEAEDAVAFVRAEGLPALARALFNANEFLFIP